MTALAMAVASRITHKLTVGELVRSLASGGATLVGAADVVLQGAFSDSRSVEDGSLFIARSGQQFDGARFIDAALAAGAAAVLCEKGRGPERLNVPLVKVDALRDALGLAAHAVYGHPTAELSLVGITGTNGKTTTASILEQLLAGMGRRVGRMGTLGFSVAGAGRAGKLTTPEADEVARFAAEVVAEGGSELVMEVSSHALSQGRVTGAHFEVAAFSNLSQDHLDFHDSLADYRAAKRRLFSECSPERAVVNVDDEFGKSLAREFSALTVSSRGKAYVSVEQSELSGDGVWAELDVGGRQYSFLCPLLGQHNLDNVILALGIISALGLDVAEAVAGVSKLQAAPGRMQQISLGGPEPKVLVDYAHTPDALERALELGRSLLRGTEGRLICVFGCGGDRDRAKRSKMGEIVGRLADRAVITNDNPRTEDPKVIALAIEAGMKLGPASYHIELDRRAAIRNAVFEATPNDVVLVAGKGHETYQIVGSEVLDFDDRQEARDALSEWRSAKGPSR